MAKLSDINAKLEYLDGTKYMIKEAIRNKGQEILDDENVFRDFVEKINNIITKSNFHMDGLKTIGNYDIDNTLILSCEKDMYKIGDYSYITLQKSKLVGISLDKGYTYKLGIVEVTEIEPRDDNYDNVTFKIIMILPKTYPEFLSRNLNETGIKYGNEITGNEYNWYSYEYSNLDVSANDVLSNKQFIGETGIETGTMPNNGQLNYTPTETQQVIPEGYTSGGIVEPMNITTSNDYITCLALSRDILGI